MIHYRRQDAAQGEINMWFDWPENTSYKQSHFKFYYFRIDGIEYRNWTAKFQEEFDKHTVWMNLSK